MKTFQTILFVIVMLLFFVGIASAQQTAPVVIDTIGSKVNMNFTFAQVKIMVAVYGTEWKARFTEFLNQLWSQAIVRPEAKAVLTKAQRGRLQAWQDSIKAEEAKIGQ